MDVVVTGGSGAIGHFVIDELAERDHTITVFDIKEPDLDIGTFVEGDVSNKTHVAEVIDQADAVIHLASLLPPACQEDPSYAEQINVRGTINVFEAALEADARVVYASSKAVFGAITGHNAHPSYDPLGEDGPKKPMTVYGKTKLMCEEYLDVYRQRGLDVAGVRFGSTYGPGKGEQHGELALIPEAIEKGASGEEVTLPGGDQQNDFVYYRDLARGLAATIETAFLTYPIYHLGSGTVVSMRRVGEAIEKHTSTSITVRDGLDYYDRQNPTYCRLDVSRARSDLGYDPEFGIDEAVQDYLSYLNE